MDQLTIVEKAVLRDAVKRRVEAAQAAQDAQADLQRMTSHFEAVLNTIVRLKDIDPDTCSLRYDLEKDLWELHEVAPQVAVAVNAPDGPGDIPPDVLAELQAAHAAREAAPLATS